MKTADENMLTLLFEFSEQPFSSVSFPFKKKKGGFVCFVLFLTRKAHDKYFCASSSTRHINSTKFENTKFELKAQLRLLGKARRPICSRKV